MAPLPIDEGEIARRLRYYPPAAEAIERHGRVRAAATAYGSELARILPEGREKSLAITALEESTYWANAAIAREGSE